MIFYDAPQGSQEWLEARRAVITGSRFKDCRDKLANGKPSKARLVYAMDVARERVGGTVPPKMVNAAMRSGTEQESFARRAYEAKTGNLVEEIGFVTTDDRMFGVSPDGLVDDDGLVEIKTLVSSDTLFTCFQGDYSAYLDQCYGQMWLLGRKWVDLVLWAPDMACIGRELTIHRLHRDDNIIEKLEADLMAFSAMVDQNERLLRQVAA
jgi:exodeoxyribonuclease (lambda-induced)